MNTAAKSIKTTNTTRAAGWMQDAASHIPEYACEAAGLGIFMLSACVFGVLIEHPASAIHQAITMPFWRRIAMGMAMGLTALAIIRSPIGQRSGGHLNPAVTLSYWLLGKIRPMDAVFYIAAQFTGGILGVIAADLLIGAPLRHMSVNWVVTQPGAGGVTAAFAAEAAIAFLMMTTILLISNHRTFSKYTPWCAAFLIANFIAWESPYSGMSMNPARTFGSAFSASDWTALWVYFTAPLAGMTLAALIHGREGVFCAKLHHHNNKRCIFRCRYGAM